MVFMMAVEITLHHPNSKCLRKSTRKYDNKSQNTQIPHQGEVTKEKESKKLTGPLEQQTHRGRPERLFKMKHSLTITRQRSD